MNFYDVTFFADAPIRIESNESGVLRIVGQNRELMQDRGVAIFPPDRLAPYFVRAAAAFNAVMAEWKEPATPAPADDDIPF